MNKKIELIHSKTSILHQIKYKKDGFFNCKIIDEKVDRNLKIKFMSIILENEIYKCFKRDLDEMNLKNKEIYFKLSNINIDLINGYPFFHIKEFNAINNNDYKFDQIKIYNSVDKIDKKNKGLCCLILKAKEIYKSLINDTFIFEDLSGKIVNIEKNDDYNFENGKIYIFSGYLYNPKNEQFVKTLISSIKEYSSSTNKIYESNKLNEIKFGVLSNFKATIQSFNINDTTLNIEDRLRNKYKVKINFSLLKKISLNYECTFFNFKKTKNNNFYIKK